MSIYLLVWFPKQARIYYFQTYHLRYLHKKFPTNRNCNYILVGNYYYVKKFKLFILKWNRWYEAYSKELFLLALENQSDGGVIFDVSVGLTLAESLY